MVSAMPGTVTSMSRLTGNTRVGLAVLCTAQFVVVLDVTIVATAMPKIGADLGFAAADLSWVITAYTVVLAGLLILGGRAADLAGARRIFRAGLVTFSVASLACALAWSPAVLIAARGAQGVGAALLSPAALAALNELVQSDARRRALGWWTAAAAGGGASGWVLGGLITEYAGWRWVFAVNAPIGLAALLVSHVLPPSAVSSRLGVRRSRSIVASLDLGDAVLVTVGIALGALGLSLISERVGSRAGWVAAGLSSAALAWFVRLERRARQPLVPGSLLRAPGVLGGNLTAAALTGSTTPAMLMVVLYVQDTLELPPARGALLFPAFNVAVICGSLLGPIGVIRWGIRPMLVGGFAGVVSGTGLLLMLPEEGLPRVLLLSAFALMGMGLGVASVASTTAGLIAVVQAERGVAAGLLNSTAQLGTALGLALVSPLAATAAPMTGYQIGFVVAALIGVAGAASALSVPRHLPEPTDHPPQPTS
jgi:MFS family permease